MKILIRVLKKYEVRNWCGVERERVGSGEESDAKEVILSPASCWRVADPHSFGKWCEECQAVPSSLLNR